MIRVVVAKHSDEIFQKYLMPYLDKLNILAAIVEDSDDIKDESIFSKYNNGINSLVNNGLSANDIVCFIHEDVKILDPDFVEKLEMVFNGKQDVGMLGVVGSSELLETCMWWNSKPEKLRGHIIQENSQTKYHLVKGKIGYFDDMVIVDGLFFAIRGKFLIDGLRFDDKTYQGFDFYDADMCFQVLELGYKVACVDILMEHRSIGEIINKDSWQENSKKL